MPLAMIEAYMERLPARLAETQLAFSAVSSLPHIDDRSRSKLIDQWEAAAHGGERPSRPATAVELALIGIGVQHVSAGSGS